MGLVRVALSERLELRDTRGLLVEILLGHDAGRWVHRVNHQQRSGDMWGSFGDPGFLEDHTPTFTDRDAALAGAIAHAREKWAGREREMAPHFAWLTTLEPANASRRALEAESGEQPKQMELF